MFNSVSEIAMMWQKILTKLKKEINDSQIFNAFIEDSYIEEVKGNTLYIKVKSQTSATLLQGKYNDLLNSVIEEVSGNKYNLSFVIKGKDQIKTTMEAEETQESQYFKDAKLNENVTFDDFIVGSFNEEAAQAAKLIAREPGSMFNPLFLYSESGLGKTHLMTAAGNYIRTVTKPGAQILYITGQDFVEQYIKFVKGDREAESIKDYICSFDVLLFDDVQFLTNKVKTQEMFFVIYEKMINSNKQIVITSDKQPQELVGLEDRLITRFSKGLLVNIKKPDKETCIEILKNKVIKSGLSLDKIEPSVLTFYADKFSHNIRELEGAFNRLIFYTVKLKQADCITIDLAMDAVKNMVGTGIMDDQLIGTKIINAVADYFKLLPSQLTGLSRTADVTLARHIAMYLIRYKTQLPLKQIGSLFNGKDHTTVMSGITKVENEMKTNTAVKDAISELEKTISQK